MQGGQFLNGYYSIFWFTHQVMASKKKAWHSERNESAGQRHSIQALRHKNYCDLVAREHSQGKTIDSYQVHNL